MAQADTLPPPAGPSDDGSCDTRPTTYPADGSPVPADAGCVAVVGSAGHALAEVWTWQDTNRVYWYNYAAVDVPTSGAVTMCGSTDDAAADELSSCSPNSTYLLFTVSGLFVEWPTWMPDDLYFCQTVTFGDGAALSGTACSTIANATAQDDESGGESAPPTVTAPPPTASAEPTEEAPVAPPTDTSPQSDVPDQSPVVPDPTGPVDPGTPAEEPVASATPTPSASTPAPQSSSTTAASVPGAVRPGDPGFATQTPVQSESIAVVGGSGFPMVFVLVLAAGLGLGGYITLAGPGLLAARRRRP